MIRFAALPRLLVLSTRFLALAVLQVPAQAQAPLPQWQDLPVGGGSTIRAPRESFRVLGETPLVPQGGTRSAVLAAPWWLARNRPELTTLPELDATAASSLMRSLQAPVHVVLGRWSERTAEFAIDVLRLQRAPGSGAPVVQLLATTFTPAHGARWQAARAYLTAAEGAADPGRPGRNPFAAFAGTDPADAVFHHASLAAAEVAVGHAVAHYRAALGLLAVTTVDGQVSQTTGGNWFRQTVTTTVTGTSRVDWLVALPGRAQPQAMPAAICVVATPCVDAACTARKACPDPALVAGSRASFDAWGASSLPSTPEEVYRWSSTQGSWNPFALIIAAGVLAAVGALDPQSLAGLDSATFATAGAGLLAYALFYQAPGGAVPPLAGSGPAAAGRAVTDGVVSAAPAPSPQQAAMDAAIGARTIAPMVGAGGLAALREAWATALPAASAAGGGNAAQVLPAWNDQATACREAGLAGADLARCAGLDATGF